MAGIEKRKERRIKIALPIKIIYQRSELEGFTGNVSRLGTYAEIQKELPVGAEVEVVLTIAAAGEDSPGRGQIRCMGNVFRAGLARELNGKRYYGLGIFFTGFPEETDRKRLSGYIDYLIFREEKAVKDGVKQWRRKKKMRRSDKVSAGTRPRALKDSDVIGILNEILSRLDEIRSYLMSSGDNK
jgi:hypothetical protein